ncbi:TPA: Glu-tRNA(Gln) amidotransferase subunit GatD [Candidatus Woesearchaeota archaeon]|nr:Glutamyl-tRNA(Gln) amidotransferase subunit D [archaeon GW2011_AR15]MBS3103424.1 Glu-tRNA(Gln) amidotransferase subunit GatD [Candidatus Woesearchaeota archaeon]HIH41541.1 Glu-tRNA(Gln) amidotransferase subunit GatD [Candidatus Woesearchaeota archaeon]
MSYKPGDRVEVTTKNEIFTGVVMPSPELSKTDSLILKLANGYNMGIAKKKIEKVKVLKKHTPAKGKKKKKESKKGLPVISILHTGGTIASKVDYQTGGVISRFTPEEILAQFPELGEMANINSRLMRNMWSEDMRFAHYNLMAKDVEKEVKKGVSGVIITHGTDTLHYSSAALAFMLEDLGIPVILVGAQRSSDRGSTDAGMNLICAARFILKSDFSGVAICMHGSISDDFCNILPAAKSRKLHTSRRDAFKPVNASVIARVYYGGDRIEFLKKDYKIRGYGDLKVRLMKPDIKVGILKAHPNMYAEEIEFYSGFDGLVLEGTGLGQMPVSEIDEYTKEHTKIFKAIKKLVDDGTVVAMSPQTIYGKLQMNVYAPARQLQTVGVLGNYSDMTPETTFIKLAWLLSNYSKKETKELLTKNLRGEINERLTPDMFLY